MVIENPTDKKCFNRCPNCGATDPDIDWGEKDWTDDGAAQGAECQKCGAYFKEYYTYSGSEFEVGKVPRVPCPGPMILFYKFMDEVGEWERVSTAKDCIKCDVKTFCTVKHCLMTYPLLSYSERRKAGER